MKTEYKIVEGYQTDDLSYKVNKLLKKGWQLVGGAGYKYDIDYQKQLYFQALIQVTEDTIETEA